MKAKIIARVIVVDVRRQSSQPTGTFGTHRATRFKTLSHSQEQERSIKMRNTRQGSVAPNGGESLTLQQIMETMQALQETVVASIVDEERIQIDLAASLEINEELQRTNEELRRGLQNQAGKREVEDQEPATPPRDFPMPFSQAIMDAMIPATFVGPKATFTGVEDPKAHLTTFHTQMMLVGGSDAVCCKLFMSTLVGTTMDWFISLPDGHVTSFAQLSKLFRE